MYNNKQRAYCLMFEIFVNFKFSNQFFHKCITYHAHCNSVILDFMELFFASSS